MAPSPIKTVRDAYPPHELTLKEIDEIIEGWRVSTENLVKAGLDGVEIHAAHGYLPAQFLSPLTNQRSDAFGGSFENRMRFLHLVVEAMRSVTPAGFALGVRLSGEEEIPGGMDIDDCVRVRRGPCRRWAGRLLQHHPWHPGKVRQGLHRSRRGGDPVRVPGPRRHRRTRPSSGSGSATSGTAEHAIKARPRGPGRHGARPDRRPGPAREVADGSARRDPWLPGHQPGLPGLRPAPALRGQRGGRSRPAAGVGVQVARAKEIYVIGGGPAGLEAARVSAERGHRVTLFERDTSLGGAVRVAAASPHRATLIDIVDYLERETRRLKVDVNLGAPISLDDLEEITGIADHVVLATGSRLAPLPTGAAVPRRGLRRRGPHRTPPAPTSPAPPWCTTRPTVSGRPTAPPRRSRRGAGRSPSRRR